MKLLLGLVLLVACFEWTYCDNAEKSSYCDPTNGIASQRNGYVICSCKNGYLGNGIKCTPISACGPSCCAEGFQWKVETKTCVDIDECSDASVNKCTSQSTCTDTSGSYLCAPKMQAQCGSLTCDAEKDCLYINGQDTCADPCDYYLSIPGSSRLSNAASTGIFVTDRYIHGWVRYTGDVGVRMQESCTGAVRCGSAEPLTLQPGSHPMLGEGITSAKLLCNKAKKCTASSSILIKACPYINGDPSDNGFYIYKLPGLKSSEVYCTDPSFTSESPLEVLPTTPAGTTPTTITTTSSTEPPTAKTVTTAGTTPTTITTSSTEPPTAKTVTTEGTTPTIITTTSSTEPSTTKTVTTEETTPTTITTTSNTEPSTTKTVTTEETTPTTIITTSNTEPPTTQTVTTAGTTPTSFTTISETVPPTPKTETTTAKTSQITTIMTSTPHPSTYQTSTPITTPQTPETTTQSTTIITPTEQSYPTESDTTPTHTNSDTTSVTCESTNTCESTTVTATSIDTETTTHFDPPTFSTDHPTTPLIPWPTVTIIHTLIETKIRTSTEKANCNGMPKSKTIISESTTTIVTIEIITRETTEITNIISNSCFISTITIDASVTVDNSSTTELPHVSNHSSSPNTKDPEIPLCPFVQEPVSTTTTTETNTAALENGTITSATVTTVTKQTTTQVAYPESTDDNDTTLKPHQECSRPCAFSKNEDETTSRNNIQP